MIASDKNARNLCYALPSRDPEVSTDNLHIVVPNILQMGWCESPPFFCAATETARYFIQNLLQTKFPPHQFEAHMMPLPREATTDVDEILDLLSNVTLLEVFVDDFIVLTDNLNQAHLLQVSRAMLYGINTVFPPPDVTGHKWRRPYFRKEVSQPRRAMVSHLRNPRLDNEWSKFHNLPAAQNGRQNCRNSKKTLQKKEYQTTWVSENRGHVAPCRYGYTGSPGYIHNHMVSYGKL